MRTSFKAISYLAILLQKHQTRSLNSLIPLFVIASRKPNNDTFTYWFRKVRIYYGTRTHKQIGQVVKEFRRLPYTRILRCIFF